MPIEKPPILESDPKKAEEKAYAEKPWRESFDKVNLTSKEQQELNDIANEEGEKAGKEYDAKEKRQSLQGVDDQYLPQYEERALHDMKQDFAKKIIETESADKMIDLSRKVIATQKSIDEYNDEYKKKYNKDAKKLSPLEWVRYQQYKLAERKKLDFINQGISEKVIEKAFQENLDKATNALKNKESQIIHLEGLIKNEVVDNNPDFDAVLKGAPELAKLGEEKIVLEKNIEKAGGKINKVVDEKEGIKKIEEVATKVEVAEQKDNKSSGVGIIQETETKNKTILVKEAETKNIDSTSTESKPGKATKRELPGWLKILLEGLSGVALIALGRLFSIFEKQVGKKKGK